MKKIAIGVIIVTSVVAVTTSAIASTIQLPKTGQTTCYDTVGNEILCTGTGQDGDIQAGVAWPNPRFTDNGNGTVTDNLTGLMWTKDANLPGGYLTWQDALDYVKTVNTGGYTDWRLPNVNELKSLVDYSQFDPAVLPLGNPFTNVQSSYWSSTTTAGSPLFAWFVYFYYGGVGYDYKGYYSYAWPVRAGQCRPLSNSVICLPQTGQTECYDTDGIQILCAGTGQDGEIQAGVAWPNPRFTDNGNGTVTDNLTGLMWTKDANPEGNPMTWHEALDYVKTVNTGGHTDWRLPNVNELESLVDYSKVGPAVLPLGNPFTNVQSYNNYWSSTNYAYVPDCAWIVSMYDGGVNGRYKSNYGYYDYAWPVRAGGSFGTSTIYTTTTTSIKPATTTVPTTTTIVKPTTTILVTTTTTTTTSLTTTTTSHTTTTTICSGPCCVKATYGEDSEEIDLLRKYRDEVLSKTSEGQVLIKIYYKFSPIATKLLEHRPLLKNKAKMIIDSMLPGIRKKVEDGNKKP